MTCVCSVSAASRTAPMVYIGLKGTKSTSSPASAPDVTAVLRCAHGMPSHWKKNQTITAHIQSGPARHGRQFTTRQSPGRSFSPAWATPSKSHQSLTACSLTPVRSPIHLSIRCANRWNCARTSAKNQNVSSSHDGVTTATFSQN